MSNEQTQAHKVERQENGRPHNNRQNGNGDRKKHFKRYKNRGYNQKRNEKNGQNPEIEAKNPQSEILMQEPLPFDDASVALTDEQSTTDREALPTVEIVGVRFRTNTKVYYFDPDGALFKIGDFVIVETSRGLEFGTITISNRPIHSNEITSPLKKVLRLATDEDIAHHEHNRKLEKEAAVICVERVQKFNLDMKIVDVEYTFDNSKLLFYFTSEGRVDFRELVKNLASVFRTRIELRQIGIRDEAKMMGGLGSCGRPYCCASFLSDFAQVSIKMAKEQNFSLNSAKISGSCGRLMCCLRYEHEAYEEAIKASPRNGATVSTPDGTGTVIETRPLAGLVKVRLDDKNETPRFHSVEEVTVIKSTKASQNELENQDTDE